MMPAPGNTKWNEKARAFRDESGRLISRTRVRASLDRYLDNLSAEVGLLTSRLVEGEIDIGTWQTGMADAIKRGHVTAATIAVGGRHQLSQRDLGKAGSEIRYQYGRLNRFARQLEAGRPLNNGTIARAQMYALAPTKTYETILRRDDLAAGYDLEKRHLHAVESCKQCRHYARPGPIKPGNWHKAGSLPSIGEKSSCLSRCRCTFERRRSGNKPNKVKPKPKPIQPPKPKPIPKPKPPEPRPEPIVVKPPPRPPEPPKPAPAPIVVDDPMARIHAAREAQRASNREWAKANKSIASEYAKMQSKFPDLMPPGKIQDRIANYKMGDAKVEEIVKVGDKYESLARMHEQTRNDLNRQLMKLSMDQQQLVGPYVAVGKEPPPAVKEKAARIKAEFDAISVKRDEARNMVDQLATAKRNEVFNLLKVTDQADIWQAKLEKDKLSNPAQAKYREFEAVDDRTWVQVDHAVNFLKKITARGDVSTTVPMIAMRQGQRAHMNDTHNVMAVNQNESIDVVVHEFGHAIDADFKSWVFASVGDRSKEFMKYRVGDEPFRPMRDFGQHFDEDEQGRKDKFDQALSESQAYYAGKEYAGARSEILALGVQALYNDPVSFARKDPEYAKYVLGILDGSLR